MVKEIKRKSQNPKDKKNQGPNKKKGGFNPLALVIALFVLALFHNFLNSQTTSSQLSYDQFLDLVKAGNVAEVEISDTLIRGHTQSGVSAPGVRNGQFSLIRVPDEGLVNLLKENNVKFGGYVENTWMKEILFAWVLPFAVLFILWSFVLKKFSPGSGMMSFGKNKAKLAGEKDIKTSFEDVAGIDEAKEELEEIVSFLKQPEKFKRLGGKIPRGVLLVGSPGTGKTLLARALAGEAKVPFYSMSGSDFVEMFVGVGASRVRDLFSSAKKNSPCIIFIDEIDSIGRARSAGAMGSHEEREQTLNQLLAEMDGFEANQGVIVLAATNRPEILDSALLRPGRFDRHISINKPDIKGRLKILKVHAKKVKLAKNVDLDVVSQRTAGFVGADLANIINESALLAARLNKNEVGMDDIEAAIDRVIAGLEMKSKVMSKREREITAYHEAGHAIVAYNLKFADPVHKVTIIPRGIGALGFTLQLPKEDRYVTTKSELKDRLAVLFGGRIAEKMIFDEISTGAENDLKRATDIAKSMVKDFAMSDKFEMVTYEGERRPLFTNGMGQSSQEYSQETAREIDLEVNRILREGYERAVQILKDKNHQLETLAQKLLELEVVEQKDLEEMFGPQISQVELAAS